MKTGSRTYTQHIECIHEEYLANQNIRFCFKGDITKCDECPFKEPKDIEITETWASTDDGDDITYIDASNGEI